MKNLITVHVVAWMFNGGGGFYWFYKPEDADTEFEAEKLNCDAADTANWHAARFDVEVTSLDTATDEIDDNFDAPFEAAPSRYPLVQTLNQMEA